MIYRLRVILDNDTNEDILRDVEIDKNSNLTDLHELILLSFNFSADTDGLSGIQELAGQATHLFYTTDESKEGRNAFMEKRDPDFSESKWLP